ncbi:AAA family ATPase [Candidatus Woesearchaeota archaeon]|jgi:dephospho-CoA kinase|nr:AAA family ATPase [Candidatus Woesearchaeota archaeon]MBT4595753.1 AAA family ATPase [Candidatus Woesearchaeota archaeon]MBT5741398.1 AAA family ATPase [Candidatus Woesearchaeota archaeon]MBT6505220.1 AAA family ATPase [Candidatus Woesearchaeota archaeon]MBT7296096.1 AAA family ATPase [Candidatus Woesearchaeota archaeon]
MQKVIGVIGPIAAGKDSVATYLQDKLKINSYQISSELKDLAKEKGIPITRKNLINLSRELVSTHGDDYLARRILNNNAEELLIIVGMRQVGQIDYLRANYSMALIGIDATPKARFERVKSRQKTGDPITFESFLEIERKDDGESVQKVSDCMKQVDYLIQNDGSTESLYLKVEEIISKEKLI